MLAIKFSEKILVQETATVIFACTQDYNNRLVWDIYLKSAKLIKGATIAGKGVKDYCVAHNRLGMKLNTLLLTTKSDRLKNERKRLFFQVILKFVDVYGIRK